MATIVSTPTVPTKRRAKKDDAPAAPRYHIGCARKANDPAYAAIWTESGVYVRERRTSKNNPDFVYAPRIVGSSVQTVIDKMTRCFPDAQYAQNADAERDAATQHAERVARKVAVTVTEGGVQ